MGSAEEVAAAGQPLGSSEATWSLQTPMGMGLKMKPGIGLQMVCPRCHLPGQPMLGSYFVHTRLWVGLETFQAGLLSLDVASLPLLGTHKPRSSGRRPKHPRTSHVRGRSSLQLA